MHYPCHQLFKEPLDEPRLRRVLVELCAEDGIQEKEIDLTFHSEQPNPWPPTGSWAIDYFIESNKRPGDRGHGFLDYALERRKRGEPGVFVKIHVWNGQLGQPTVAYFYGSGKRWDGSSNFNFCKELMSRYTGNPPNIVFQKPEISAYAAARLDQGSFLLFMLKMPVVIAKNLFCIIWNIVRARSWAGGNRLGFKAAVMNFTAEESQRLYAASKKLGVKPFAVFSYAAVKACKEVLKQQPLSLMQQASLQTRHFPLEGQTHRDLVGDWLFGPVQVVPEKYGLQEAMAGYEELKDELDSIGPRMQECIMAKAYGILNSGAAGFQMVPTYNSWHHPLDRCIFMNNYGVRTMPPGSPFHTWNWNAPLWLGLNTINVDGCTTTLVGSCFWGLDVVEAIRDSIEATLRGIMAEAGSDLACIPSCPSSSALISGA